MCVCVYVEQSIQYEEYKIIIAYKIVKLNSLMCHLFGFTTADVAEVVLHPSLITMSSESKICWCINMYEGNANLTSKTSCICDLFFSWLCGQHIPT